MIELVKKAIGKAIGKEEIDFDVSASEKEDFGHYSTNVAFKLAPVLKKKPLEIAKEIESKVKSQKSKVFVGVEAVAPGFVNFWLKPEVLQNELKEILKNKNKYGKLRPTTYGLRPQKINLEFVSANPTGPLTMANGRGGFYGDVLANVLENAGHKVTREYYVNDAGNQIRLLGESIRAEMWLSEKTQEHYKGTYIKDYVAYIKDTLKKIKHGKYYRLALVRGIQAEFKDGKMMILKADPNDIGKIAQGIILPKIVKEIKNSLKKAGIKHDVWFSEDRNLHKKGEL